MTDGNEWSDSDLDFTIASGVSDPELLSALRDYFAEQTEQSIQIDRWKLNTALRDQTELSKSDAESLFTGLVLSGVATQEEYSGSFADYSFRVQCEEAARVLENQRIARAAIDEIGVEDETFSDESAELTATFPPGIDGDGITRVRTLSSDLRNLCFDADTVVRIANPYFDPNPSIVGDIAGLSNRGIETRILTRETASASRDLVSALNGIYGEIEPANRHQLQVRDLYKRHDETGRQAYATHAKVAITDRDVCYIGSANLTPTSLSDNFELGVLLRGENVEIAADVFDTVFEFAREVGLPL